MFQGAAIMVEILFFPTTRTKMSTVRIKGDNFEKLTELAVNETVERQRPVTTGELVNDILEKELPKLLKKFDK